jgi:SSS family solute:Na+ symporter
VRSALAACWLAFMACNLGIMLFASAKMMSVLFGWDQATCIWATAILVGIYTCAGGLAAVVYTDMIQCVVMIGGCLLVLVIGLIDIGGVGELKNRLREIEAKQAIAAAQETGAALPDQQMDPDAKIEHASLILPVDTKSPFPWTGILFGLAFILSPAYWIGNQAIVQRSLGAKSEFEAKQAYIWGAVLKNIIPIIIAVPGLIAFVKYPELADGDQAFPMLVSQLLPTGIRGLFLAAFLAALMSSVDSYLNSASTILSHDLYKRFLNPAATDERLLIVGRTTTVALVCWAIMFAFLVMDMKEGIYTMFQTLMAFFQGPALAILLPGIFWKRANGIGAGAGFVCGVLFSISLYALNQPLIYETLGLQPLFQVADPFLYFSVWAFLLALGVLVVVSLLTKPEPEEKLAAIFDRHKNTKEPTA